MKCPFELPVCSYKAHDRFYLIRGRNFCAICKDIVEKDEADYLVKAINSHELHNKIVSMLNQYQTDEFWNENPKVAIDTICEVLKEAEKS